MFPTLISCHHHLTTSIEWTSFSSPKTITQFLTLKCKCLFSLYVCACFHFVHRLYSSLKLEIWTKVANSIWLLFCTAFEFDWIWILDFVVLKQKLRKLVAWAEKFKFCILYFRKTSRLLHETFHRRTKTDEWLKV